MKAALILAVVFSTASVCLYISGNSLPSWSVPIEPDNANGGLGINAYCPNTNYFANGTVLSSLQVEELSTACVYVDYNCNIAVGVVVPPGIYTYYFYNIFDPKPLRGEDDLVYQMLKVFPGPGSCQAFRNARFFGGFASAGAFVAFLFAPFGLCSPRSRKATGSSGTGLVCCGFVCGIVALSCWAGSVINWQTSEYGSGFWCMMSAVIIGALSIPCLSAFALVQTQAPEYQVPPPGQQQYPQGYGYYPQAYPQQAQYDPRYNYYQQGQAPPPQNQQYNYYQAQPPPQQQQQQVPPPTQQ